MAAVNKKKNTQTLGCRLSPPPPQSRRTRHGALFFFGRKKTQKRKRVTKEAKKREIEHNEMAHNSSRTIDLFFFLLFASVRPLFFLLVILKRVAPKCPTKRQRPRRRCVRWAMVSGHFFGASFLCCHLRAPTIDLLPFFPSMGAEKKGAPKTPTKASASLIAPKRVTLSQEKKREKEMILGEWSYAKRYGHGREYTKCTKNPNLFVSPCPPLWSR